MASSNRPVDYSAHAFWCFALSLAFLPVGFGANRPIPLGIVQAGMAASCLFLTMSADIWQNLRFFKRIRWAFGLFALVLLWAFIQTQPFVVEAWKHPVWQEAATVLKTPLPGSISVVPEDGLKGITRLITYIAGGLLAYVLAQDARRARQLVKTVWVSGIVICAYGLVMQLADLNMILWFDKWAYEGDLTATFVNRNHFAIYAGMVLTCGVALLMQSWRENMKGTKPHQRAAILREWIVKTGMPQIFLIAMVLISITLSHSRAGLVLSLIGLAAYLFFYQIYLRAWFRAAVIAVCALVFLGLAVLIAVSVSEHFASLFEDYSSQERSRVYEIAWRALQDNPWLGYGINGFEPEYRLYQQNMLEEFNHAHSDILESLLDLGFGAGLMLWSAIALLLSGLWHGVVHRRRHGLYPTLGLAVSIMALGHAAVDFDLQIPGVALTWAALMGTGLAQSWRQSEHQAASAKVALA